MKRGALVGFLLLFSIARAGAAEEPSGCDKFKWNIDHARAALTASDRARLASGAELNMLPASGVILSLVAPADAKLPTPPERAPKDGTFAGSPVSGPRRKQASTPSACPRAPGSTWCRMAIS